MLLCLNVGINRLLKIPSIEIELVPSRACMSKNVMRGTTQKNRIIFLSPSHQELFVPYRCPNLE